MAESASGLVRCPSCGNADPEKFQIGLPAWFRLQPERAEHGDVVFHRGDLVSVDDEAAATVFCEVCEETHHEDACRADDGGGR